MKLRIKLYASLKPYLPAGTPKNEADIEIAEGASVQSVLDDFNMPAGLYLSLIHISEPTRPY